MDDNLTQIILAAISLLGVTVTGILSYLSLRYAAAAKNQSTANSVQLGNVASQVDGLTRSRVEAEQRVGEQKAATARAEGRLEEMARQAPAVGASPPHIIEPGPALIVPPREENGSK